MGLTEESIGSLGSGWEARRWLESVRDAGEVHDLGELGPEIAIGAIAEGAARAGHPTCFVAHLESRGGPAWRVVIDRFGSSARHAIALGLPREMANHEGMLLFWRSIAGDVKSLAPKLIQDPFGSAVNGDDINLAELPTSGWPPSAVGSLGAGCHAIWSGRGGRPVVASCAAQVLDHKHLSVVLYEPHPPSAGQTGPSMPARGDQVAVTAGADPILSVAWSVRGLAESGQYEWVGGVRGTPLELWRLPQTDLTVPARAEVIIGGVVGPELDPATGGWAGSTGYFEQGGKSFTIEVSSLRRRQDPILFADVAGRPPHDQAILLSYPRSALLEKQLRAAGLPNLVGAWCLPQADSHLMTVVAVRQSYAGHAVQALNLAAQAGAAAYASRYVIVVDEDIDIFNLEDVLWALLTRCDPERDIRVISRTWSGNGDPALRTEDRGHNSRLAIDATRPWEWIDQFAEAITSPAAEHSARERWGWILKPGARDPR